MTDAETTQSLINRIKDLEQENEHLKQILKKSGIDYSAADVNDSATKFGLVWNCLRFVCCIFFWKFSIQWKIK